MQVPVVSCGGVDGRQNQTGVGGPVGSVVDSEVRLRTGQPHHVIQLQIKVAALNRSILMSSLFGEESCLWTLSGASVAGGGHFLVGKLYSCKGMALVKATT